MADRLFTSSSKSVAETADPWPSFWKAAVAALAVIAAVELTVWYNSDLLIEEFQLVQRIKKRHYLNNDLRGEIPIIGDSSGMHIDPAAVLEGLGLAGIAGRSAFNYNWPYYGVEAHTAFLRMYLRRNPEVPALILSYPTLNLSVRPDVIRLDFVPIWFTRAKLCLPRTSVWGILFREPKYLHLFQQDAIETITPATITYKSWILQRARAFARTRSFHFDDPYNVDFLNQWEQGGFLSLFLDTTYNMEWLIDDHQKANGPETADFNELAIRRFHEIAAITAEARIPVIVVPSPVCETHARIYHERGIFEAFELFAREMEATHSHVRFLMHRAPVYPDELFGDIVHVNRLGQLRHNEEIREGLRAMRASLSEAHTEQLSP